ncbi:hypothetical protein C8R26_101192 [Nitrosomonas oligotropha]|uniref:Uncharacterized protein n=1 Tax=Nitrosomonas oligotropha TaxID=42354 RepID=A0A2T5I500_9PROT|nr:hypothetical protein [Nitrosomonas oligotropha]PTQ78876.1 hypothetical protein C8R26_101192 [Nitrosomonas oligotropha]
MPALYQVIVELLNTRKNRVLLVAQSSLPESQYKAFRQIFLNEFGKGGLEKELERVIAEKQHKER